MVESIEERILQNIQEALEGVTQESGCYFTLTVEQEDRLGNSPADGKVVIIAGDPIPQDDAPVMHDEYLLPVGLQAFSIDSEDSDLPVRTRLARLASDIRKAITQDVHRGGIAVNTEFPEKDDFQQAAAPHYVLVKPHIRYRTLYQNPYKQ